MKNTIDDAIYTASSEIIRRRYNPLLGIILTVASIVMLWANSNVAYFDLHEMAAQWNLLISSCLFCTGLTMVCYWLFGDSSAPLDKQNRERLYRSEYSFESNYLSKVRAAVESGDFTILEQLPRCYQASSQVVCYRTDSGSVIAAQVLTNHEAAGEIRIFKAGQYKY